MNKEKPLLPRPPATGGLHHVALWVTDLEACEDFYVALMGMQVEWRPDDDNVYLSGGNDNLALHRVAEEPAETARQRLDHIGFILRQAEHVDLWHSFLHQAGVTILTLPRTHRDGARSFYCLDPSGTRVQVIHHPPLAN